MIDEGDYLEIKDRKRLKYSTLLLPLHSQSLLPCLYMQPLCLMKERDRGNNNLGTIQRSSMYSNPWSHDGFNLRAEQISPYVYKSAAYNM